MATSISNGESGSSVRTKLNNIWEGLELNEITATIADTAVDIFVYDTRKDSDGGAWRKRTQHASWYNEALNTATRGSRKEFPAVAIIVAESNQITIYDGDDPDLPMWMTLNITGFGTLTSVAALNGLITIGRGVSGGGAFLINYIEDTVFRHNKNGSGYSGYLLTNIVGAADGTFTSWDGSADNTLVNGAVNDVAMTVLPNAPIDAATGLPVPTIAVATDGGVSVIKDDGTVADSGDTSSYIGVNFDNSYNLVAIRNDGIARIDGDYSADGFSADTTYSASSTPALLGTVSKVAA